MDFVLAGKLMLGASLGAVMGYFLTRVKTCAGDACKVRPTVWYSMLAGAVFGAALAYYLVSRPAT